MVGWIDYFRVGFVGWIGYLRVGLVRKFGYVRVGLVGWIDYFRVGLVGYKRFQRIGFRRVGCIASTCLNELDTEEWNGFTPERLGWLDVLHRKGLG